MGQTKARPARLGYGRVEPGQSKARIDYSRLRQTSAKFVAGVD